MSFSNLLERTSNLLDRTSNLFRWVPLCSRHGYFYARDTGTSVLATRAPLCSRHGHLCARKTGTSMLARRVLLCAPDGQRAGHHSNICASWTHDDASRPPDIASRTQDHASKPPEYRADILLVERLARRSWGTRAVLSQGHPLPRSRSRRDTRSVLSQGHPLPRSRGIPEPRSRGIPDPRSRGYASRALVGVREPGSRGGTRAVPSWGYPSRALGGISAAALSWGYPSRALGGYPSRALGGNPSRALVATGACLFGTARGGPRTARGGTRKARRRTAHGERWTSTASGRSRTARRGPPRRAEDLARREEDLARREGDLRGEWRTSHGETTRGGTRTRRREEEPVRVQVHGSHLADAQSTASPTLPSSLRHHCASRHRRRCASRHRHQRQSNSSYVRQSSSPTRGARTFSLKWFARLVHPEHAPRASGTCPSCHPEHVPRAFRHDDMPLAPLCTLVDPLCARWSTLFARGGPPSSSPRQTSRRMTGAFHRRGIRDNGLVKRDGGLVGDLLEGKSMAP